MGVMAVQAVLQDRWMDPQERPPLLGVTDVTGLIDGGAHQLIGIRAAMGVVTVGAGHQSFEQRHV